MKTLTKIALVLIPTLAFAFTANAHDPKLHAKKAEKADCSSMDHAKMDLNDPVAKAMMDKCAKQAQEAHAAHGTEHADHSTMKMDDASKAKMQECTSKAPADITDADKAALHEKCMNEVMMHDAKKKDHL